MASIRLVTAQRQMKRWRQPKGSAPGPARLYANYARTALILLAIDQADSEAAVEMYSSLTPSRNTILASTLSADRLLGRIAQALGRGDDANQNFQDALKCCRDWGY